MPYIVRAYVPKRDPVTKEITGKADGMPEPMRVQNEVNKFKAVEVVKSLRAAGFFVTCHQTSGFSKDTLDERLVQV